MKNKDWLLCSDLEPEHQSRVKAESVATSYAKADLLNFDHSGKT